MRFDWAAAGATRANIRPRGVHICLLEPEGNLPLGSLISMNSNDPANTAVYTINSIYLFTYHAEFHHTAVWVYNWTLLPIRIVGIPRDFVILIALLSSIRRKVHIFRVHPHTRVAVYTP